MSDYITTYTGNHIDPANPDPEAISIRDIAHALSLICRGNGHVRNFWSSRTALPGLRSRGAGTKAVAANDPGVSFARCVGMLYVGCTKTDEKTYAGISETGKGNLKSDFRKVPGL